MNHKETHLIGLEEHGDLFALGGGDAALEVTLLLVGNPARRFGVEGLVLLLQHLLVVTGQVLEVRVPLERIAHHLGDFIVDGERCGKD